MIFLIQLNLQLVGKHVAYFPNTYTTLLISDSTLLYIGRHSEFKLFLKSYLNYHDCRWEKIGKYVLES